MLKTCSCKRSTKLINVYFSQFTTLYSQVFISPFALSLTHEVGHDLAHGCSKYEVLEDVGDEGEGHAEDGHHQVAHSERQQEGVSDGAHSLVDSEDHNDEQVSKDTQEEDERVKQDPERVALFWKRRRQDIKE